MASWPITLPTPQSTGLSLHPVDQVVLTNMEAGNVKARRTSSARRDGIQFVWKFTDAEMAIFRNWFDDADEADGGAAWFTVSLPTGDGGSISVEARFSGVFQSNMIPVMNWEVSATLEVRYA